MTDHQLCGAKTRGGGTCKRSPIKGATRCRISAGPWIRTTAGTGDLEALLDAAVEANRDPWAHLPHIGPA